MAGFLSSNNNSATEKKSQTRETKSDIVNEYDVLAKDGMSMDEIEK